jgi:hypothetical protein
MGTKGTEIGERLLLEQYNGSLLLKQYLGAFTAEMDILFDNIEAVYFGRNLDTAVGHELDVLGRILGQSRNINLAAIWFAFYDSTETDGLAGEENPRDGGLFFSETGEGFEVTPLPDDIFKRLLQALSSLATSDEIGINNAYKFVSLLLGRVPSVFTITEPAPQLAELTLARSDTSQLEEGLILYVKHLITPAGTTFNINLV